MRLLQINTTACDGSDVFWPWFLWLLAAFLLGLLLGWLLKQLFGGTASSGTYSGKQDLQKVEGIGPKIEELLNKKGIENYNQLSNTDIATLEKIIADAGPAFYTHRGLTITWPAQAKLAETGQWEELEKWQGLLKEGV